MAAEGADSASPLSVLDGRLQNFINRQVYRRRAGMVIYVGAAPSAVHGFRACRQARTYLLNQPRVRCQARSAAALL